MDTFGLDIASRESWTRGAFGRPEGFLIQGSPDDCKECWGCVRYCPARAIRVTNGVSEVVAERCVKCGACVSECGNCGRLVRDDTPAVRELLRSGRPVVALLATEFVAAMHPMASAEVERALESLGFYAVESTLLGEELVAGEYERLHSRSGMPMTLRSTCPVTVDWVKRYRPSFASALTPVVPPYVAQARLIRALYPKDIAVVYVSPCYARKDEIHDEDIRDAVDVAIDFVELKRLLATVQLRSASANPYVGARRPEPLKELSLTDGFPRSTLVERDKTDSEVIAVRGLRQLDRVLDAIEGGEAVPAILDMLNCDGCIDGPAVNPGLSVFAKRNIVAAERETRGRTSVRSRDLLAHLPPVEVVRSFKPSPMLVPVPTPEQVDAVLAEGDFANRSQTLDCGACGYGTCVEHAQAILAGLSTWEMCFPLQRRRMRETNEMLEQVATSDSLTGLLNRRGFDERLSEEVARGHRYGSPLSLMMMDIDGFKDVNDRLGHAAGDAVLRGVAAVLREGLRETDIPTRYGGDEFALVLPGIRKTEAYAVAEKLREAVSSLRFNDEHGEAFDDLRVTVSAGVASLSGSAEGASSLLES
ncbi:MAG: diguanylate cyclase, partial [Coriobacteriia bacterium]|nr:diguanylate cyclase [Coriobacteriia bacterium]